MDLLKEREDFIIRQLRNCHQQKARQKVSSLFTLPEQISTTVIPFEEQKASTSFPMSVHEAPTMFPMSARATQEDHTMPPAWLKPARYESAPVVYKRPRKTIKDDEVYRNERENEEGMLTGEAVTALEDDANDIKDDLTAVEEDGSLDWKKNSADGSLPSVDIGRIKSILDETEDK